VSGVLHVTRYELVAVLGSYTSLVVCCGYDKYEERVGGVYQSMVQKMDAQPVSAN